MVRSKLLARLNSRSRSLCRLVEGDDDVDCSLFLFVNKDDCGAPVNFRIGCGGELLSLLLLLISYISDDSSLIPSRSSEESALFLGEATLVKDLIMIGCLI